MNLLVLVSLACAVSAAPMDLGAGGVYDSPMSTDYYVKQFGFLFGGGRSGLSGIKAMQESQDKYHRSNLPSFPRRAYKEVHNDKKMIELAPLMVESKIAAVKPTMFHRFMAVP